MAISRNVDDIIVAVENEKLGIKNTYTPPTEVEKPESTPEIESKPIEEANVSHEPTESKADPKADTQDKPKEAKQDHETAKASSNTDIDDYGNEIPKQQERTYTQGEVNNMIRERLARGRNVEQPTQQQVQQAQSQGFQHDPNSGEDWQVQLKAFVKEVNKETQQEERTLAQQQREFHVQQEFQEKFTSGMNRYSDFNAVITGKPITDAMMLAARGMSDPAAFMYSAAKHHPKELERIANIPDPYQQGMEIGKLEANMKKARAISSAAKPLGRTVGDMSDKENKEPTRRSVDQMIMEHAKHKSSRR